MKIALEDLMRTVEPLFNELESQLTEDSTRDKENVRPDAFQSSSSKIPVCWNQPSTPLHKVSLVEYLAAEKDLSDKVPPLSRGEASVSLESLSSYHPSVVERSPASVAERKEEFLVRPWAHR